MTINHDGALVAEQLEQAEQATQEFSPVLYTFTNKEETGYLDSLLAMFYQGVYDNELGIMEAFNLETEQEELILVGVVPDENGKPICYPVASVLKAEDVPKYLSPDGKGGYFSEQDPTEAAEAREHMKALSEVVEA